MKFGLFTAMMRSHSSYICLVKLLGWIQTSSSLISGFGLVEKGRTVGSLVSSALLLP
jgi:hypothetical protein